MKNVQFERRAQSPTKTSWLIQAGDKILGKVDKSRNTRNEAKPWKVFRCTNQAPTGFCKFSLVALVYPKGLTKEPEMNAAVMVGNRADAFKMVLDQKALSHL